MPVGGQPVLDYILTTLTRAGITDVILAAGHLGSAIAEYYQTHRHPCTIRVVIEDRPRGTAGALNFIRDKLDEHFVLVYGDVFTDFDIAPMLQEHMRHRPMATLLVRESDHPWDSDLIDLQDAGRVVGFIRERAPGRFYKNVANAAVYVLSRQVLDFIPLDGPSDFGGNVFPAALAAGAMMRAHRLAPNGMVKDMGTPKRKQEVEEYLLERALAERAHECRGAIDTVFVDRDGTLNRDQGHIVRPDTLQLLPGVCDAVAKLTEAGIRVVVITNQPVIARGMCSVETLESIHQALRAQLQVAGGRIDAIYYCPHHPETHHGIGVTELRRGCRCRKPASGLLFQAVQEHHIDLGKSVMVGDRACDVQAGRGAGVRTVLVGRPETRWQEAANSAPDAQFNSLLEFVDALLAGSVFAA